MTHRNFAPHLEELLGTAELGDEFLLLFVQALDVGDHLKGGWGREGGGGGVAVGGVAGSCRGEDVRRGLPVPPLQGRGNHHLLLALGGALSLNGQICLQALQLSLKHK